MYAGSTRWERAGYDGLLLSPRDRLLLFLEKCGYTLGPTVALALIALVTGGGVVAVAILALGGLIGIAAATSARTRRGAIVAGLVTAAFVFAVQVVIAWFVSHPILPGD
jgi:hypothetical protein